MLLLQGLTEMFAIKEKRKNIRGLTMKLHVQMEKTASTKNEIKSEIYGSSRVSPLRHKEGTYQYFSFELL